MPAFLEAGRVTAGDVHWARVGDRMLPVGETEFARDATFGYRASNLRDYIAEKSGGTIASTAVHSIGLHDVRLGGPSRVADILMQVTDGAFVVVNATDYADLEVVVLGLLTAEDAGRSFLSRVGPSFPGVLAGLPPRRPLVSAVIWPTGRPPGHGLIVVGSHVGLTSRQIEVARRRGGLVEVELHVEAVLGDRGSRHLTEVVARITEMLSRADVLLFTSRSLIRGSDAATSLDIARHVSDAVVEVVRASAPPSRHGLSPRGNHLARHRRAWLGDPPRRGARPDAARAGVSAAADRRGTGNDRRTVRGVRGQCRRRRHPGPRH